MKPKSKKTFYVTTPIFYPSGSLHIGHLYTTTLAWVLKRYKLLQGYDAVMLTGTDEHGQKIAEKAALAKIKPQQYVDEMSQKFKHLWKEYAIDYEFYSRTTNPRHMQTVQTIFQQLCAANFIYKGYYQGLYSVQDEEFLTKTQAQYRAGKYYSLSSNHELKLVAEPSYFLKTSAQVKWLLAYYEAHPRFILPQTVTKELRNNFLLNKFEDLSITRNTFAWSIPIAPHSEHVIYVWLDALNNYLTALNFQEKNDQNFQKYWKNGHEIVHLVGKEITRFHGIYWPMILKMMQLRQPSHILVSSWIVTPEGKMSKSKGNVVDPLTLLKSYDKEVIKYYFASQIAFGQDSIFDEANLKRVFNADLANNFGNLVARTVAMSLQNFTAPITYQKSQRALEIVLKKAITDATKQFEKHFDQFEVAKAFEVAIELSDTLNRYIDETKPWLLTTDLQQLALVLNHLFNGIYAVATFLSIVMPEKMALLQQQLGQKAFTLTAIADFHKFDFVLVKAAQVLFQRIK